MTPDPYRYFRAEARDLLDQLNREILGLEKEPAGAGLVSRILRLAHTLKGAARVVKQPEIAEGAHGIEELLAPFRDSSVPVPGERTGAARAFLDTIAARLASLSPAPAASGGGEGAASGPGASSASAASDTQHLTVRAEVAEIDELVEGLAGATAQLRLLQGGVGRLERARSLAEVLRDRLQAAGEIHGPGTGTGHRVGAGEGTRLRALAEELRALLLELSRSASAAVAEVGRELAQAREAAQALRLAPASLLFTPLERTARDAAKELGLKVAFEASGGDVRLDARVVAAVQRALVQLVRNAVAHGIEPEAGRRAAGKPPEGKVRIEVGRRGREIVLTCRDDGRGVDLEGIRRAARRKGLSSGTLERHDAGELLALLFRGGITTASTVTEVSGRGIGLDVVREFAEKFGGRVSVTTSKGEGTAIELALPLSVASLESLVVEASGETAAVPLDAVRRTIWVDAGGVSLSPRGEHLVVDGSEIPFAPLSSLLRPSDPGEAARGASPAVVFQAGDGLYAIGVERLLGIRTVVLRPVPDLAPPSPLLAGLFRDAEGRPRLVLEPEALAAVLVGRPPRVETPAAPAAVILVVDDSLTTRMLEQSILESAGYDVDVAASAEEGLEKARSRRYALFLVDVEMPGMDGFEFVEKTRADPELGQIPAILVTSRSSAEDRRRGREAGARDYIVKSEFEQGGLLQRIGELVS